MRRASELLVSSRGFSSCAFVFFPKLVLFHLLSGVTCAGRDRSTYETIDQQDAPPQWPDSSKTAQQPY